jgi:hypothetical protein
MSKRSDHDFWITLKDTKAEEWVTLLGPDRGRRLPVMTPIPQLAHLPGFDVPQRIFLLALDCMEPNEIALISGKLAAKFGMTPDEAEEEIRKVGIPIREEHIDGVIVHRPQRWF